MGKIKWWNIELGEEEQEAIRKALATRHIAQGEITEEFESRVADFLNVPYAVAVPNGTQALSLAYMASGLKGGDEVIISNRTFIATAHAAMILGAKVRVVDVKENQTIDEDLIEDKITNKTKLVVPVHMNGVASNMDRILEIAKKYNLQVIEDSCQAFGSRDVKGRHLGTIGRFGCFSLGLAKILTTGQGGLVVAHNKEDYDLLRRIRNQGVFDVRLENIYNIQAYNFKFNDIQASIGIVQLSKMKQKIERVKTIYKRYQELLSNNLQILEVNANEVPMRSIIIADQVKDIKDFLEKMGIGSAYEIPSLNHCSHLKIQMIFPKSDIFHNRMLILPSGPDLKIEYVDEVCLNIKRWFGGN